jgi:hypothetical protein
MSTLFVVKKRSQKLRLTNLLRRNFLTHFNTNKTELQWIIDEVDEICVVISTCGPVAGGSATLKPKDCSII